MANMELIGGPTGGQISSATSSITFSAIPQTYTDLMLKVSVRTTFATTASLLIRPNGSTANQTAKRIYATGSTVLADTGTNGLINGTDTTVNTFANTEIYFPNYTSAAYKPFYLNGVMENNATFGYIHLMAFLWSDNTAISSLTLETDAGNFATGSTFYLYGISNVTSGSKATGGIVSSDGTYWYHMFPYSSTFTPTQSLTADYLIVAGGGSGGANAKEEYGPGGGGAGALRYFTSQSLTAQAYTATVGAGGAGKLGPNTDSTSLQGNVGTDSTFNSSTSAGGGGGGGYTNSSGVGGSGGSGGGGDGIVTAAGGSGTTGGNNGGTGSGGANRAGGGGGGAGAVGANGTSSTAGAGGAGLQYLAFATATNTGANNGYYAGGGGGVSPYGYIGAGGLGGGGASVCTNGGTGVSGIANTGSGGGAVTRASGSGGGLTTTSGAGGSGIIIIRYAI